MNLTAPKAVWDTLLGFFYPEVCQLCKAEPAGPAAGFVGERCAAAVRWIRPPFCGRCGLPFPGELTTPFECANCRELELHFRYARAAVVARTEVLEVIHGYKYRRQLWFEPFLAGLLIAEAVPVLRGDGWDALVPVPLHPHKEREREFNQALRLARRLGAATGIPVAGDLLERVSATVTQTHLTRELRAENMRKAFAVRAGAKVERQRFVLVDDVLTTGATTNDCARALRAAGAGEVCVWTVARGT